MEFVKPGKYVELTYDLYEVENGKEELMLSMTSEHPERIVFGETAEPIGPAVTFSFSGNFFGTPAGYDRFPACRTWRNNGWN